MVSRLVAASLLCTGCSLAFPMSGYDEGSGGAAAAGTVGTGAATGSGGNAGAGGELACGGTFVNPPFSEIKSTFDAGLGPDLAFIDDCGSVQEGRLVFEPAHENHYCWAYNVAERRLTCDALTIKLIDAGSQQNGMQRFIYFDSFDGEQRAFVLEEVNGFGFQGLEVVDASFDPVSDAWWRLRADPETVVFETSPDGATWTVKGSGPHPFSLDSVRIGIGAGMWQLVADPQPVRYDCLDVPPPCP